MLSIISVRDNKNNKWKRKIKSKPERNKEVTQAIVKVWELNDFVVRLRFSPINILSFFNFQVNFRVSFINYFTIKILMQVKECRGKMLMLEKSLIFKLLNISNTSLSNQIKFENLKSSIPLKRFFHQQSEIRGN